MNEKETPKEHLKKEENGMSEQEQMMEMLENAKQKPEEALRVAHLMLGRDLNPNEEEKVTEHLVNPGINSLEKWNLLLRLKELEKEEQVKEESGQDLFNLSDPYLKHIVEKYTIKEDISSKEMIQKVLVLLEKAKNKPEQAFEAAALILGRHIDPIKEEKVNEYLANPEINPYEKLNFLLGLRKKEQDKTTRKVKL
ncbi:MAG: hypothetical protein GF335_03075 [Candidatus Moranbacteria bacterium]|nr:hypothetical protein [Candidatus Moranbacteria bacterium]